MSVPTLGFAVPEIIEGGTSIWKDGSSAQSVTGTRSVAKGGEYITLECGSGNYEFMFVDRSGVSQTEDHSGTN